MWYRQWTKTGDEEKTGNMVNDYINHSLVIRCIVPYRRKRKIHKGMSMFRESLFFPSYFFRDVQNIRCFAKIIDVIREITSSSLLPMTVSILTGSMDFLDCWKIVKAKALPISGWTKWKESEFEMSGYKDRASEGRKIRRWNFSLQAHIPNSWRKWNLKRTAFDDTLSHKLKAEIRNEISLNKRVNRKSERTESPADGVAIHDFSC